MAVSCQLGIEVGASPHVGKQACKHTHTCKHTRRTCMQVQLISACPAGIMCFRAPQEKRMQGIEDSRGVSRDEMAAALLEVAEGRVPKDRIALKWVPLILDCTCTV